MRKLLVIVVAVGALLGWLAPAEVAGAYGALPAAPGVASAVAGNGTATVSWTAPSNTGGKPITGYVVTPVRGTVTETARTFKTSAITGVVTGLANGGSYRFRVAAKTANGTGPQSALPAASAAVIVGAPSRLALVTAVPRNASALVSWSAPASTNGSAVTGYAVTPIREGVAQTPVTFNSTARSQTVTGLVNGSSYAFQVAAINARGKGVLSVASSAFVVGSPVAPTGLAVTVGARSVSASWAVSPNNGSAVTGWKVWALTGAQTVANTSPTYGGLSITFPNLSGGSTYRVVVAAVNARGTGPSATSATFVAPKPLPYAPGKPMVLGGNGLIATWWTAPTDLGGVALTGYKVTPILDGTRLATRSVLPTSSGGIWRIPGLTNGATYRLVVAAVTSYGTGPESVSSEPVTVGLPGSTSVASLTVGDGSATVTWPAAASNGNPITSYRITPFRAGVAQPAVTVPASPLSATITGLDNGEEYRFSIAATNAAGTGPESVPGPALVGVIGAPSAPALRAAEVEMTWGRFWLIDWDPPANDNGSPLTGYKIVQEETDEAGNTSRFETLRQPGDARAMPVTPPWGGYTDVYVSAINARGSGAPSHLTLHDLEQPGEPDPP